MTDEQHSDPQNEFSRFKFRVWQKERTLSDDMRERIAKMVYGVSLNWLTSIKLQANEPALYRRLGTGMSYVEVVPAQVFFVSGGVDVLMQCTGRQDKHGKDIYEGDIVEGGWAISGFHCRGVVEWNPCGWNWSVMGRDARHGHLYEVDDIEVVGNIYENPQELKGAGDV